MNDALSPFELIDLAPVAQILIVGAVLATLALVPLLWRQRHAPTSARLRALTVLTTFLTFDLVMFGAFTRLTDSGLGCPDWPGCYATASPLGAHAEISAAQAEAPHGPVTHQKAWIEMVHRYLATGVGALLTVLMVWSWRAARRGDDPHAAPRWAVLSFLWVCVQGAFGALTVTMKLYPLIVTLHLLGGIVLLALLAWQAERYRAERAVLSPTLRAGVATVLALLLLQSALGGWVSTNYAVLACEGFPTCSGQWWPDGDYAQGFELLRPLGQRGDGQALAFSALVAIHWVHRLGALAVTLAVAALFLALRRHGPAGVQRLALALATITALQLLTGLSNVVLGWPLVAAVLHTGGAAALVAVLTTLLARTASVRTAALAAAPRTAWQS
jgi:cytochrome c oxidase assembly protein subunit 15